MVAACIVMKDCVSDSDDNVLKMILWKMWCCLADDDDEEGVDECC